ncbi:MAG: FIST N-terminal domain-containing protein, partial [Sulfuricurvum sp.]|uniref:FIST signal transduction protein n=1 Tax=Sulfuricurvum sp. TaxID=2025608 RepID=UPI002733CECF
MRLINHRYENRHLLSSFIETHIPSSYSIFIQLFSGNMDLRVIQSVLDEIALKLPNAVLIGATTAGEIMNGSMQSNEIILAFSLFDTTDIKSRYFSCADFESGVLAARELLSERSKACIAFGEGLHGDSESFLRGFASIRDDIIVAGGNAGDDLTFTHTAIMHNDTVYERGIVIVVLESDCLQVHNNYSLNWTSIGKEMVVTRADKNIIYEIEGRPVKEVYAHYLGPDAVSMLPASAVEFPFIKVC